MPLGLASSYFFYYVTPTSQEMDVLRFVVVEEPQTYFEGSIGAFNVELRHVEGRCSLAYVTKHSTGSKGFKDLEVGMAAPCNFIRATWKELKPLSYTYGTDVRRVTALLVTGGPPADPNIKDESQPKGCGTWMAKVLVFADRIEIEKSGFNGPPWCPSSGADEVMFAA